jgi:hypothetical protein
MSNELFVLDNGKKVDAGLHAEMLDDDNAERAIAALAVQSAISSGLSAEDSEQFYGYRGVIKYNPNEAREPAGTLEGGRWTSAGGTGADGAVQLWHGTSDEVLAEILKEGLIPGKGRGGDAFAQDNWQSVYQRTVQLAGDVPSRKRSVYLTTNPDTARNFAAMAEIANPGSKSTVLQITMPRSEFDAMPHDEGLLGAFRHIGKIPPEWITRHEVVGKKSADPVIYAIIVTDEKVEKAYNPNQLRVPAGQSGGGRWTSGGSMNADDGGMKQYIDTVADQFKQKNFEWLRDHSQAYAIDKDTFIGGKAHECYKNTFDAVINNPERDLTYVEGYVSVHGVPVHHAWAATKDGKVRDYTIKSNDDKAILGYYGVPIKDKFVMQSALETKLYGVTIGSNWQHVLSTDPADVVKR